jgi:hypothetical protein
MSKSAIARRRCRICRKWYRPHRSAVSEQKTCSAACRRKWRNQLARGRRLEAIEASRRDERQRQRRHRANLRASPPAEGSEGPVRGPVSRTSLPRELAEIKVKIMKKWDKVLTLSRTTLDLQLTEISEEICHSVGQGGP